MRGTNAEEGNMLDRILRRIEACAGSVAERRRKARVAAAACKPGQRIRTTGKCCLCIQGRPPVLGTIVDYIEEADDYHVILDHPPEPGETDLGFYVCRNGFEPTGETVAPPTMAQWVEAKFPQYSHPARRS